MNNYLYASTFRMLLYYWRAHCSIMLQIAAGIAVIYASTAMYYSIQTHYEKMLSEINKMTWNINVHSQSVSSNPPLDYSQYTKLKELFPSATLSMYVAHKAYFPSETGELEPALFVYASDDFIHSALKVNNKGFQQGDVAYAGARIEKAISKGSKIMNLNPNIPAYSGEQQTIFIGSQLSLPIRPIDELQSSVPGIKLQETEEIPLANVVLLPFVTYYMIYNAMDIDSFRLVIDVEESTSDEQATSLIMKIMDQLLTWNGSEYSYQVDSSLQKLLLSVSQVRDSAVAAAGIAGICLIIVALGLVGLIHVLFHRRKQTIAISTAVGARKMVVFKGLLFEATLPSLLGGIIGTMGCAYYLSEFVRFREFEILQPVLLMVMTIGLSLLPGALSAATLIYRIRRLQPLEILKRE